MLTANEIREVTFTKNFGGYKMCEVDDFLDECITTVEKLTAENKELNSKLEKLADKLLEYRNQEGNIQGTMISAQKSADGVMREANHKAELIIRDAQIKGENAIELAEKKVHEQEEELEHLQQEVSNFRKRLMAIYKQHIELIAELPAVEEPVEEPAEEEPIAEETPVEPTAPETETAPASDVAPEVATDDPMRFDVVEDSAPSAAAKAVDELENPKTAEEPSVPLAPEHISKKPRFSDLRFGENYDISSEEG